MGLFSGAKPRTSYWGGSKENYAAARDYAAKNMAGSRRDVGDAAKRTEAVANAGAAELSRHAGEAEMLSRNNQNMAEGANVGMNQAINDAKGGRGAILNNASALERNAANAGRDYQQTSQAQFGMQQDANQRAAMSLGASGGASGLRSALAASSQANAQAAGQAGITQAQEMNNIRTQQQQALAAAAQVRAGVGAQDLGAAKVLADRSSAGANTALGALGLAGNTAGKASDTAVGGATAVLGANVATSAQDQDLYLGIEGAQQNAAREREAARVAQKNKVVSQASLGLIK